MTISEEFADVRVGGDLPPTKHRFWTKPITPATSAAAVYADFLRQQIPLRPRVILYETMSGSRVGDNPYAIFEYLRAHPEYGTFLHVWTIDAMATIPDALKDAPDVVFARRGSRAFTYFLACATSIICNANLPSYFVRRPGQRYLNTWHGTAYKSIGRDTPRARFGAPSGPATFLKATHVLSTCAFMTDAMISAYSMAGVSSAIIAETGYPRVDQTITPDPSRTEELRHRLGLDANGSRPVVLYAPTYRGDDHDMDTLDLEQLLSDLKALSALDITLLYRGHHRTDRILRDEAVGQDLGQLIIPNQDINSNELLTVVDILITDYSSIFFDFLPTGKPVVHYLYDHDEYKQLRGLNIAVDDLPGVVAFTSDDLIAAVTDAGALAGKDAPSGGSKPTEEARYRRAQRRFCPHDDGNASKRAVEFFFRDTVDESTTRTPRDERPTVVFWAGDSQDVQDEHFLQGVIAAGENPHEQATLVVARNSPLDKGIIDRFKTPEGLVATVPFTEGAPVLLPDEVAAYEAFVSGDYGTIDEVREVLDRTPELRRVFVREYRRRLDDSRFDKVVLAPSLSPHELALASLSGTGSSFVEPAENPSTSSNPLSHWGTFNVLLLTNRDSDNVGDQLIEAIAISLIQGVLQNLGGDPTTYRINSRAAGIIPKAYLKTRDESLLTQARTAIRNADVIIFGGAPLFNYSYQDFYLRTIITLNLAQEYGVPVLFSSIGVEPYSESNPKSQQLKAALAQPVVRQITTRDDIESTRRYAEGTDITVAHVSDPAVFADVVFGEGTIRAAKQQRRIGLVVTRAGIFKDNGITFNESAQRRFWLDTIAELKARGYDYRLFTTGHFTDEVFLDSLVRAKRIPMDKVAINVNSPEELHAQLSSCDGIIAFRLHASIAAFAYSIPAIGLSWNFKVPYFYESVGHGDRALPPERWTAAEVVPALERAMEKGVFKDPEFLYTVYETLFCGLKGIVAPSSLVAPYDYNELRERLPRYAGTSPQEYRNKVNRKLRRTYESYQKLTIKPRKPPERAPWVPGIVRKAVRCARRVVRRWIRS